MSDKPDLHGGVTMLDLVHAHPATQEVFTAYSELLGVCLLCSNLFDTLDQLVATFGLDREQLLKDLRTVIDDGTP